MTASTDTVVTIIRVIAPDHALNVRFLAHGPEYNLITDSDQRRRLEENVEDDEREDEDENDEERDGELYDGRDENDGDEVGRAGAV
jgi:hypothetical protein